MILMTGGSRGLGLVAAEKLTGTAKTKIMGVRNHAIDLFGWETHPLNLASLTTVRSFVSELPSEPITHLILNAGGQRPDADTRTIDGFEMTFATNHLAHYLLLRLLMPQLADGARVVVTSSGTHDPREKTGVPPPRHAKAEWLAHPDRDPNLDQSATVAGMRAYSSSKLCNLMTALYLARSEEAGARDWSVYAYDPGLTPGTSLVRNQAWIVRALVWPLLPLVTPFSKGMNSMANAGRGLAQLATTAEAPQDRVYAALRKGVLTWPDPSSIAQDTEALEALWDDSAELVGVD
jgi:NAD(P)-dependent dehydrogenase (short-subunit alcohol dehydrogenase family)